MSPYCQWHPNRYERFERSYSTSIGTSLIVTDLGKAYIKPLGNRQGPHVLACEWVATRLADWFGLQTLNYSMLNLEDDDEIPLGRGNGATAGPAFVTKEEIGFTWGGGAAELDGIQNPDDVSRLVVFDTWTRNCDRHPQDLTTRKPNYDNVFISTQGPARGTQRLIAMDHTHCFTCGGDLTAQVANIGNVNDPRVYGLFPAFVPHMRQTVVRAVSEHLLTLETARVREFVESIPAEWQVEVDAKQALCDLIMERATFVAESIEHSLALTCWPHAGMDAQEE